MERPKSDPRSTTGIGRSLLVTIGVAILIVGLLVATETIAVEMTPPYGLALGLVASVLGIELVAIGLTGRRYP